MKVYLDNNDMCHLTFKEGYREAEHGYFDTIPSLAVECYKFIPEKNFIQCVDSKIDSAFRRQAEADNEIVKILTQGL